MPEPASSEEIGAVEGTWAQRTLSHECALPCLCRSGPNYYTHGEGDAWRCGDCGRWWVVKMNWWERYWSLAPRRRARRLEASFSGSCPPPEVGR